MFRAFATDPQKSVILYYKKRPIIISPESPEEFVRNLEIKRKEEGA
ncbi:hypothetical protein OPIT5_29855 [Opitutaceae bacterium TAV5]|nr:hypothetical protein OPIT5_29855 [Opitutaceae bacterium TAV5]